MIEPGYAWLRVAMFQEPTVEDLVTHINNLYAKNPNIKGIVLDLRNDPGGILPELLALPPYSCLRLVVVSTNGQLPESKAMFLCPSGILCRQNLERSPGKTASPDQERSSRRTGQYRFGFRFRNCGRRLAGSQARYHHGYPDIWQRLRTNDPSTFERYGSQADDSRYYTPSGRSIQAKGIVPDLMVDETAEGDGINGLRLREADPVQASDQRQG